MGGRRGQWREVSAEYRERERERERSRARRSRLEGDRLLWTGASRLAFEDDYRVTGCIPLDSTDWLSTSKNFDSLATW